VIEAHPSELPTSQIALSLLFGFTFMLVVEQLFSPHSHSHDHDISLHGINVKESSPPSVVEFDAELGELGHEQNGNRPEGYIPSNGSSITGLETSGGNAYPLTFGLIVHGLADGLALGLSSMLAAGREDDSSNLSFIVFLALLIHKSPTALALTTSLLASSIPRSACKKHLAAFSASTPFSAIASYLLLSVFGRIGVGWSGIALLISGGTFLYVATVLQPVSQSGTGGTATLPITRVLFISIGIFIPFTLSAWLGHGH